MSEPGNYQGRHYTTYPDEVRAYKRGGRWDEAEQLLLHLLDAVEAETREKQQGVAPWYYEQLAIVRRKQKNRAGEIAILQRFTRQQHAPGVGPTKLLERLRKLTGEVTRPNIVSAPDAISPSSTPGTSAIELPGGLVLTATFTDGKDDRDYREYGQAVVGESHYQEALRDLLDNEGREFTATLEAEPDNQHDSNAVKVCGPDGETLGYLPRAMARRCQESIVATGGVECEAKLFGGTRQKRSIGVWLDWEPKDSKGSAPPATIPPAEQASLRETGCGCLIAMLLIIGLMAYCF